MTNHEEQEINHNLDLMNELKIAMDNHNYHHNNLRNYILSSEEMNSSNTLLFQLFDMLSDLLNVEMDCANTELECRLNNLNENNKHKIDKL